MDMQTYKKPIIGGLISFVSLVLLLASLSIVNPTEIGFKVTLGRAEDGVVNSGLNIHWPFISGIQVLDTRVVKIDEKGGAASKDLQIVNFDAAISYHINPDKARDIFLQIGTADSIQNNIVLPAVNETLKSVTSQYTAEEIITKRPELKTAIDKDLSVRLDKFNIILNEVSLVNVDFSADYNQAIEQKQVAQQNALKAAYQKDQAVIDAQTVVISAQGQSDAQKLLVQSLSPELIQKMWIDKWNGILPTTNTGDASIILPLK